MPLYEYQCLSCHKNFEVLLLSSDSSCDMCEHCQSKNIKRLLSCPNAITDQPVWDKHSDFIKKLKPKYVKDGKTGERKRMR